MPYFVFYSFNLISLHKGTSVPYGFACLVKTVVLFMFQSYLINSFYVK